MKQQAAVRLVQRSQACIYRCGVLALESPLVAASLRAKLDPQEHVGKPVEFPDFWCALPPDITAMVCDTCKSILSPCIMLKD